MRQNIVHGITINNLLSYCGLIDAKIRASGKDLPVQREVCQANFLEPPEHGSFEHCKD